MCTGPDLCSLFHTEHGCFVGTGAEISPSFKHTSLCAPLFCTRVEPIPTERQQPPLLLQNKQQGASWLFTFNSTKVISARQTKDRLLRKGHSLNARPEPFPTLLTPILSLIALNCIIWGNGLKKCDNKLVSKVSTSAFSWTSLLNSAGAHVKAAGEFIVLQRLAVIQTSELVESPSKSLSEKTSK